MTAQQPITLRLAGPEDLHCLHALVERCYRGDSARAGWTHEADLLQDERTSDADLAHALRRPDTRIILAERDGMPCGSVSVSNLGRARCYLWMLCVDPVVQAGGIGRTLITAAERIAVEAFGAQVIEMSVIELRTELIAYYLRRGYRQTDQKRPYPGGGDHPFGMVVLERSVS